MSRIWLFPAGIVSLFAVALFIGPHADLGAPIFTVIAIACFAYDAGRAVQREWNRPE